MQFTGFPLTFEIQDHIFKKKRTQTPTHTLREYLVTYHCQLWSQLCSQAEQGLVWSVIGKDLSHKNLSRCCKVLFWWFSRWHFSFWKKSPISQPSVTSRMNCTHTKQWFYHAVLFMLFILRMESPRVGSYAGNHGDHKIYMNHWNDFAWESARHIVSEM